MNTTIRVLNAGVVLASPYLQRLWRTLGLFDDQGKFVDLSANSRAGHLLDYLVFGDGLPKEPVSALSKVICALPLTSEAIPNALISTEEKQVVDSLLTGLIAKWHVLGNTSVDGLRQSFLQRDGLLDFRDYAWHLVVTAEAFDVLLDSLPWSISIFYMPWMKFRMYVEWR